MSKGKEAKEKPSDLEELAAANSVADEPKAIASSQPPLVPRAERVAVDVRFASPVVLTARLALGAGTREAGTLLGWVIPADGVELTELLCGVANRQSVRIG